MTDRPKKIWASPPHIGEFLSDKPIGDDIGFYLPYALDLGDMRGAGYVPDSQVAAMEVEWLENDNMIYNLVDSDWGWVDGERPKTNQYMIVFSRQNSADGSDDELKAIKAQVLSALTTQPASDVWDAAIKAAEQAYINYGVDFNADIADTIRALIKGGLPHA